MTHRHSPFRRAALAALACTALWPRAPASASGELYVIAHQPMTLSSEEIKEIYLGEVQFAGGLRMVPVDNGSAQAPFLERVLRMTPAKYTVWWTKKAFRDGQNPPPARATDAQVLIFVKETPGAIGYVVTPPEGVHVVGRF
jgi:hypothetical protein